MTEKVLLDRLAELPREIAPARDPWPGIAAGIAKSPGQMDHAHPGSKWWLRAVAASVVLVFAGGLLVKHILEEQVPSPSIVVSNGAATTAADYSGYAESDAPGLLNSIDAEYLAAFREFINTGDSSSSLAPQTIEKIEMGWADLRVTEEALSVALEQNPGDLFLNERMLELRARQLGFLKQLVSLDRNNRRLTT